MLQAFRCTAANRFKKVQAHMLARPSWLRTAGAAEWWVGCHLLLSACRWYSKGSTSRFTQRFEQALREARDKEVQYGRSQCLSKCVCYHHFTTFVHDTQSSSECFLHSFVYSKCCTNVVPFVCNWGRRVWRRSSRVFQPQLLSADQLFSALGQCTITESPRLHPDTGSMCS